jgi:hypothetical protein
MRANAALAPIICAALAMACSSESRNTKPIVAAQSPAAANTSTSTTATTATGTASATNAPAVSAVDPALVKEGYGVVRRQGKILYCQTQTVTGSKFANTVCMTAEQIQELKRETEKSRRLLIRSGPANCVGTQCSN